MREMAAVGPGIAAWGVMTGVAMVDSGIGIVPVLFMSVFVFAGSSQLAALPLITAAAPMWIILATAFCVNMRFMVFSVHLRPYVMHLPLATRLFKGYLFADLNYVLFTKRFPEPADDAAGRAARDAYWSGSGITAWLIWVTASLLGVALAASIPTAWGLGFAGILALLGIMCSLAVSTLRVAAAGIAGAAAVAAYAIPLKLNIVIAIAAAVAFGLLAEAATQRRPRELQKPLRDEP
mgnify:CR=1 FL=1